MLPHARNHSLPPHGPGRYPLVARREAVPFPGEQPSRPGTPIGPLPPSFHVRREGHRRHPSTLRETHFTVLWRARRAPFRPHSLLLGERGPAREERCYVYAPTSSTPPATLPFWMDNSVI